ncbi:acyl-phosphate:glycerol-3-phosphate O-acyltransferase PlsY [Gracilibacillus boraciitolerans JCM 21714]|uniref:Glycerol-3-phosphate acyltransferase n=1 Tax=Gracilibacillus boraciitolerans JCM 21714 TaxID=1298598 RepID=W4VE79_9BACI|nr:glycerol-3-phosphate 1-O-acyltransferase PlsY [Gracilibacillus boraciitolerans]GAE91502.1 acyl-phosphate:glycerol-3-phosphate O-acyltransferase PlsY [Gracilibacillus boraciitolerans JCM 21714]
MEYIIFIILAYLLGSIPTGLIVGKVGYQKDIREHGSGNLGATNTFRVLGFKAGIIVTLVDILKGTLAAALPIIFQVTEVYPLIVGIFAVIGHMYPIFAKFKGGKAVATSSGVILAVNPLLFIIMIFCFLGILYLTKYVSLASMLTGIITIIVTLVQKDYDLTIVLSILTAFIIYRHQANIKRIWNKTEPKIKWM